MKLTYTYLISICNAAHVGRNGTVPEQKTPSCTASGSNVVLALLLQDYAIECPATGSSFSLKDGSIKDWYPNNPVLRALTPQNTCRNMDVYQVKLTQVGGEGGTVCLAAGLSVAVVAHGCACLAGMFEGVKAIQQQRTWKLS
jgi:nitrite reductase/ring-hydroxylating ferredoxin subunit